MEPFDTHESEVRGYIRGFPTIFDTARGAVMTNVDGTDYLDFFAGAGVMNYGHNNPVIKQAVMDYLARDGIVHSLDMGSKAKADFINAFQDIILKPRGLSFKIQFPGPTGTNTVEAALKLARKVTGRHKVVGFTNGFHGMTLGALAVTGNAKKRAGAGVPLPNTQPMPFDNYFGQEIDTVSYIEKMLEDGGSGLEAPAAFIVETVQGEGGVRPSSFEWLKKLSELAKKHGILLIIDDVQMGVGRTGPFFSFEPAGIHPDIVCMSKAIGSLGLATAVTLIKPEHDIWAPGEHNGTFRGNNLAFVAAVAAFKEFWSDDTFETEIKEKGEMVRERLEAMVQKHAADMPIRVRGRGMIQGMVCEAIDGLMDDTCAACFQKGLIMETSGFKDEVAKVMPPLTITKDELSRGLDILEEAFAETVAIYRKKVA